MSTEVVAARKSLVVRRQSSAVGNVVGAFESETAAVFLRTTPTHQHVILYALFAILAISVGLSTVVKLDRVVTSTGRIVPTAGELYLSPFDTGIVRQINVMAGDVVKKGAPLIVLEAMKMEHQISAPYDGTVKAVRCAEGEMVEPGVELVELVKVK